MTKAILGSLWGSLQVMREGMRKMRKIDEGENECRKGTQREEREQGKKDTTAGGGGRRSSLHRRGTEQRERKKSDQGVE